MLGNELSRITDARAVRRVFKRPVQCVAVEEHCVTGIECRQAETAGRFEINGTVMRACLLVGLNRWQSTVPV